MTQKLGRDAKGYKGVNLDACVSPLDMILKEALYFASNLRKVRSGSEAMRCVR